jgi:hypothetical protein
MKKIKYSIAILAFTLFSCDQYLDINDSPNELTFADATPNKLLPGAQVSTYRVQVGSMNQLGNVFMNSWTRNVSSFGNGYDKELQLIVDNSFYNNIWDGLYLNLMNFQAIIDYPNPGGKYDNYVAAAKICKAHYMQYIVDLYGNAPYSQAWKPLLTDTPSYDDDYTIYQDLIKNLEDARAIIAAANPNAEDIAAFDVMLAGDMNRWNEFANTLQLRLCMRMSEVTGAQATYRDSKLTDIVSGPFLSDNVTINPGFNAGNDDQASPGFNTYAIDVTGAARQNRTFIAHTAHAYKAMQSYATTNYPAAGSQEIIAGSGVFYPNVTDSRRARLFTNGAGATGPRAVEQGASFVTVGSPSLTYPGTPARLGLVGNFDMYAEHPGITISDYSTASGYIMTLCESYFLQAEAAIRYPGLGFSGEQALFDAGVTESFLSRVATMGSYLTTINTKPNFGLTASTTFDQKLHAIMYQKWIALMGHHGIESFVDYNRTGYPLTPLSLTATQTRKPYRLSYPVSEYIANAGNVPSLTNADIFTINAKTPFWVQ